MVLVEKEEIPRSIEIILTLWEKAKKKVKGVAAPPTNNSAHAPVLPKKEVNADDK